MKRVLLTLIVIAAVVTGAFGQSDAVILVRTYGTLSPDDALYEGEAVDWYEVQAPEDGRIEATAVSVDVPMTVLVRRGGQAVEEITGRESARVSRAVDAAEVIRIGVTTGRGPEPVWSGPAEYTLQIVHRSGSLTLTVGGYIAAELGQSDGQNSSDLGTDWYPLAVTAGMRLRVDVTSPDFDTYLTVELPDGTTLENDDTMGTDSSVSFTSPVSGPARVGVRAYGYESSGQYELSATEEEVYRIDVGDEITGDLRGPGLYYAIQGSPGQAVDVNLSSYVFDPVLTIDDPDGASLHNDNYDGAHLLYFFGDAGTATITVSSYGGSGEFTLSVDPSNARITTLSDGHELFDGDVISGQLTSRSPQQDGTYHQRFTFYADRGERIEITLESDSFDSYLRMIDPGGVERTDDDSAGDLNSRLTFTAERSGVYEVYAQPLGYGDVGMYTLSFGQVSIGSVILSTRGQLTPNDDTDVTGKAYDIHEFRAQAGRTVVIDVTSPSFDAMAILRDGSGFVILEDDDGGSGSDSRIEFVPDRTSTFELVVTSFSSGAYGNYTVTIYE